MKSITNYLLILALVLGLFSGCSTDQAPYTPTGSGLIGETDPYVPTEPEQEDRQWALVYYPDKPMNPYLATDYTNRVVISLIYQGLFAVSADYQAAPILCRSYNISADMKTYTFYLADAMFSDGTKVTAADVAASLEAAKGSPWYGGRLQHVNTISAYGDTVVIELSTPMENLPVLLDIPIVKAKETDAARPIGTGPYRLDIAAGGLRRQAAWWCSAKLTVDGDFIQLIRAEDAAQIRDAFEFSGVSLVCTDPAASDYVTFRSDYELWDCENGHFLYLACNGKSEVFSEPTLRAALTYAIDRATLAETYYQGFAQAASLPASPKSPWYDQELASQYAYAPEKFAEAVSAALASAAIKTNEVKLLLNSSDVTRHRVGLAIVKMLEAGGLKVTVTTVSASNFTAALKAGDYDLYLGQTRLSQNMDLTAFFSRTGSMNYGNLYNPALYATALEALANAGNYYNLLEAVMEDGQLCPILFQRYALYTQRGLISSLNPARDNLFYYDLGRTLQDAQTAG